MEEWNLPLQQNQALIIDYLWLQRDKCVDIADIDEGGNSDINASRLKLLEPQTEEKDKQKYHLSLVRLLACTCEGENSSTEAKCQGIFSLSELLQVIVLPKEKIDHINKGQYLAKLPPTLVFFVA